MLTNDRIRTGIPVTELDRTTRRYRGKLRMLALMIPTALAVMAAPAWAAAGHSARPVRTIPPPAPPSVVGTSTLVRSDQGMSVTLHTTGLTPGDVVTLWWVVFNNPAACEHPFAGSACGPDDARNAAPDGPRPSLLHAGGRIGEEDGTAAYGAHLGVGDTSWALFGPGLLDARGAHVVLVLKTHGPKIPELVSEMLYTFAGGCQNQDDVPPGAPQSLVGTPGPNSCAEVQVSVHSP
ncbi:MAG: hypothetical protein ACRDJE_12435 [Dehalococcoidia bacterium]